MATLMVLLCVFLVIVVAMLAGRQLSPVTLVLVLSLPSGVVLSGLGAAGSVNPTVLVSTFYVAFGLAAYTSQGPPRSGEATNARSPDLSWPASAVTVGVCLLTALHFALGGIPILGPDVETARFAFNSGLFGVPGRANLIALPVIAAVQVVRPAQFRTSLIVMTWVVLVASRILMGFKGGLVEIVVLTVLAYLASGRKVMPRHIAMAGGAAGAALAFAAWTASRYRTLAGQDFFGSYLLDRLGRQAAEPGWISLQLTEVSSSLGGWFVHDLSVLGSRYFGWGTTAQFAADERVSSVITGTPLTASSFLVPVTIGGPAYVWGSVSNAPWAWIAFVIVCGILGWTFGRAVRVCQQQSSPMPLVLIAVAALIAIKDFCLNGGGAYLLINYTVVIGLISAASLLVRTRHGSPADDSVRTVRGVR